ncbi:MAG: PEP-CTERM sorting domain-containing protein [Phycisphaerae bacterium]|nr:PEP-CTERM sorting domain-containing protein [Phycisphaerae bacterium]
MKKNFIVIFALLLALTAGANAALVGHWQFNETTGTTATSSVNSPANDGTLNDGASFDNGSLLLTKDSDLSYAGTSGVSTGLMGITGNNARTIAAWIKTDVGINNAAIVSWGNSWTTLGGVLGGRFTMKVNNVGNKNELRVEIGGGYTYGSAVINDGLWHHVAVTMDGTATVCSQVKLYVDGVLDTNIDSGDANPIISQVNAPVTIGWIDIKNDTSRTHPQAFKGNIDDVMIYDEALDAAAIGAMVPEPTTITLIGLGALSLIRRRRKN